MATGTKNTKTSVKKTTTAKAPVKKTTTTKAPVKKTTTAKAPVKKTTTAKAPVKKTTTTKAPVKKTTIVKAPVKKITTAKTPVKKTTIAKAPVKKVNYIVGVFSDIILLYKNFLHWNGSKLLIFVWSIILGFIFVIPLVALFFIYSLFSDINLNLLIQGIFSGAPFIDMYANIILYLIILFYFLGFSYSNILLFNLNNGYIDGKNISYKANDYFDIKKIFSFLKLSFLNLSIILIPVLLFFISIGILFLFSGSLDETMKLVSSGALNYFSALSLTFFVVSIAIGVYLYYRLIFSFLILSDKKYYDESKGVLTYIKESFNKTKGNKKSLLILFPTLFLIYFLISTWYFVPLLPKFLIVLIGIIIVVFLIFIFNRLSGNINLLKFFSIILIIFVLSLPINYIGSNLDREGMDISKYKNFLVEEEKSDKLIGDMEYERLKVKFSNYDMNNLDKISKLNNVYGIIFSIFSFIFIYGLIKMFFSSFYRRELK